MRNCTKAEAHAAIDVGQEAKTVALFFAETLIVFGWIEGYPKYLHIILFVLLDSITESIALDGSARRCSFGVKPKHRTAAC